ncbi:hypothetical protein P4S72_16930 [Vibrio sp. PP-XX7]
MLALEVFHLNDLLVDKAHQLTKSVPLLDGKQARKYRKRYKAGTLGANKTDGLSL